MNISGPMNISGISSEIQKLSKCGEFEVAYDKYSIIKHPVISFYLGLYAYKNDYNEIAQKKFSEAARFGLDFPNECSENLYSNSIGQSIYYLLDRNLLVFSDRRTALTWIGIAYYYLTVSINLIGNKAYQSYETRAKLLSMDEYSQEVLMLMELFGLDPILVPFAVANDYYESYLGHTLYAYDLVGTEYIENLHDNAVSIFYNFGGQVLGEFTFDDLRESGRKFSDKVFRQSKQLLEQTDKVKGKDFFFN